MFKLFQMGIESSNQRYGNLLATVPRRIAVRAAVGFVAVDIGSNIVNSFAANLIHRAPHFSADKLGGVAALGMAGGTVWEELVERRRSRLARERLESRLQEQHTEETPQPESIPT